MNVACLTQLWTSIAVPVAAVCVATNSSVPDNTLLESSVILKRPEIPVDALPDGLRKYVLAV